MSISIEQAHTFEDAKNSNDKNSQIKIKDIGYCQTVIPNSCASP